MFYKNIKTMGIYLVLSLVFTASVFAGTANQPVSLPDEAVQNQLGMKYFKIGYYEQMPRGQKAEAQLNLDLAERAFQNSIKINDDYIDAHRNLARLYYLQKKYNKAATEYTHVLRLDPDDIDMYVNMAVVQTDLGDFEEAIKYLEKAKTKTMDEDIIKKLNEYILKVQQAE